MLQGANILGFFENPDDIRWNNTEIKDFIVCFPEDTIPAFCIALVTTEVTGTVAVKDVANHNTVDARNLVITSDSGYKVISLPKTTSIAGISEGYYYLLITLGTTTITSDVFLVKKDLSGLVKFSVESSDITMNGSIKIPYSTLAHDFYLSYNGRSIISELNEEGVEKYFGDMPVFSSMRIKHNIEINGTKQIFRMLSFLRPIITNGIVLIDGVSIYNPLAEQKDDIAFGDSIIISFSFYEFDFIASRNAI